MFSFLQTCMALCKTAKPNTCTLYVIVFGHWPLRVTTRQTIGTYSAFASNERNKIHLNASLKMLITYLSALLQSIQLFFAHLVTPLRSSLHISPPSPFPVISKPCRDHCKQTISLNMANERASVCYRVHCDGRKNSTDYLSILSFL